MTQADFTIANQTFPNTRTELNTSLQALATNSAGNSAPSTTFPNQWHFDSDGNVLYMRNKDNDAWVQILTIGATSDLQTITTDLISEVTSAAGVTIDSLLIKDGKIANLMNATLSAADMGAGVHIKSADSGMGSVNANADELVIEGSGNSGLTILSGTSSKSNLFFGDSGSNVIGNMSYNHSTNELEFATNGANACFIESSGNFKRQAAGAVSIRIGSTNAGGAFLLLDGDSNGDFIGSDYSYIAHDDAGRLQIFQDSPSGSNQIIFHTAAVERMRITDAGLHIGGTGSANALDDYEEGTFTMGMADASGNALTMNGTYAVMHYTKIGNMVHINGLPLITSIASAGSDVRITGLPFTSKNHATNYSTLAIGYAGSLAIPDDTVITAYVNQNSTIAPMRIWTNTTGTDQLSASQLSDGGEFVISGTYIAA